MCEIARLARQMHEYAPALEVEEAAALLDRTRALDDRSLDLPDQAAD